MKLFKEELKKVEAFAFDVDGVFSRHEMNITPEGDLIRTSCTKDGYAMMYCTKKGYPVCIISGGQAPGVRERFEKLGVKDVYLGVANKVEVLNEFLQKYNLNPENVMYMGDDIPDYNVMKIVGMPVCPSDACEEIKAIARYISDTPGGLGCVRDVVAPSIRLLLSGLEPRRTGCRGSSPESKRRMDGYPMLREMYVS
uniref:KdsC family phosphatase n=1 Tax=Butyricimonas virosa TaxID=544645 RepID=UPI0040269C59